MRGAALRGGGYGLRSFSSSESEASGALTLAGVIVAPRGRRFLGGSRTFGMGAGRGATNKSSCASACCTPGLWSTSRVTSARRRGSGQRASVVLRSPDAGTPTVALAVVGVDSGSESKSEESDETRSSSVEDDELWGYGDSSEEEHESGECV